LFSYLLKLSGNHTVSEDLFQECLLKVWNNIGRYKHENKFASWLFAIAHNIAVDHLRKIKYSQKIFADYQNPEAVQSAIDHHDIIESEDVMSIIEKEVNRLPEKQKEVFLLRYYNDLAFKEISEITNQPLNTVLSHMHYAMTRLKNALREKR